MSSAGGVSHRMFLCVWFSFFSYPRFSKKEPVRSMLEDILQVSWSVHLFAQATGVPQFLDGQQRYPTLTAAGTQRYWTGSLVLTLYLLMRLGSLESYSSCCSFVVCFLSSGSTRISAPTYRRVFGDLVISNVIQPEKQDRVV